MKREEVYNFAAGPAVLATEVLERAERNLMNYHGTGMSVMEMSHRSKLFQKIFDHTKQQFISLMNIPESYEVLFLQGGASTQFSMIPMNLMADHRKAEYAITGNFSNIACTEAKKYGEIHVAYDGNENHFTKIPTQNELKLVDDAAYFHYCANNTIYGTEWHEVPDTYGVPIVCDMSSDILSTPVDVSKYGLIYAGAQKNLAPAGVTVVIIRKDLAGKVLPGTPMMLEYQRMIEKDSMYNTPPCWCIYMLGLTLDWIEEQGGVKQMEENRNVKSSLLYDVLDQSRLFIPHAEKSARSKMNVTFRTNDAALDAKFCAEAAEAGLVNLKGHRLTGGMRASIYNAMPLEGVKKLAEFMTAFEKRNLK